MLFQLKPNQSGLSIFYFIWFEIIQHFCCLQTWWLMLNDLLDCTMTVFFQTLAWVYSIKQCNVLLSIYTQHFWCFICLPWEFLANGEDCGWWQAVRREISLVHQQLHIYIRSRGDQCWQKHAVMITLLQLWGPKGHPQSQLHLFADGSHNFSALNCWIWLRVCITPALGRLKPLWPKINMRIYK